jgi:hypothetical protein
VTDDELRIREELPDTDINLRQTVRRLVKETRDDERRACAEIAKRHESFKSVKEIEAREHT